MQEQLEQMRVAVEKYLDANGAIPADKVPALMNDLANVIDAAYLQGLEDAQ